MEGFFRSLVILHYKNWGHVYIFLLIFNWVIIWYRDDKPAIARVKTVLVLIASRRCRRWPAPSNRLCLPTNVFDWCIMLFMDFNVKTDLWSYLSYPCKIKLSNQIKCLFELHSFNTLVFCTELTTFLCFCTPERAEKRHYKIVETKSHWIIFSSSFHLWQGVRGRGIIPLCHLWGREGIACIVLTED